MQISCYGSLLFASIAIAKDGLMGVLQGQGDLSTLTNSLSKIPGLLDMLAGASNITILAPTDDAFKAISKDDPVAAAISSGDNAALTALFKYHVLRGNYNSSNITEIPSFIPTMLTDSAYSNVTGGQRIEALLTNGTVKLVSGNVAISNVVQPDLMAEGITIHKIDKLLTIPQSYFASSLSVGLTVALSGEVQSETNQTLNFAPDITVFIPTDKALESVGSVFSINDPDLLHAEVNYHIVKGKVLYSTDLGNTTLQTLQGNNITITVVNDTIFANQFRIVTPNVLVANGVFHAIDGVMNYNMTSSPSTLDVSGTPSAAFSSATPVNDFSFTASVPAPTTTVSIPTFATKQLGAGASATKQSSSNGAAKPIATGAFGAVGAGVLFAGAFAGL